MNFENIKIGVVGLGYVGLPLAIEFGKKYPVIGYDINKNRISELKLGIDKTRESEKKDIFNSEKLEFSSDIEKLGGCNVYIVTVPTPIDIYKKPDLKPILSASKTVGKLLKMGDIVIYESTVYPGCTEEDCVPILEHESKLKFNVDFFCGYSPERINPGDKERTLTKILKITSGSTPLIAQFVDKLYTSIISAGTYLASSIKVAEAAKIIENCQRDINIAFVNELALIFEKIGIDTTEVLEAAGTKWNFLNFKPGLVGGHCIGVDPYYLTYKAESLGYLPQVILSGRRINDNMGKYVANKVIKLLIKKNIHVHQSKILVLGITFKENCPDIRNSRVIDIIEELKEFQCKVDSFDPWADTEEVKREYGISLIKNLERELNYYDGIILAVSHQDFKEPHFLNFLSEFNGVLYDVKSYFEKELVTERL